MKKLLILTMILSVVGGIALASLPEPYPFKKHPTDWPELPTREEHPTRGEHPLRPEYVPPTGPQEPPHIP